MSRLFKKATSFFKSVFGSKSAKSNQVVEKDSTEGTSVILGSENTKSSGLRARKAGLNHAECMRLEVEQKKQTNDLLIRENESSSSWHFPLSTDPAFATIKFSNGQGSNREHDTQISKKANRRTSDGKESCQTQDTTVVKMAESICIITEEAKMDLRPGHKMSDDQPLSKWVAEMQSSGSSAVAKQHTERVTVKEIIEHSPDTSKQHIASDETDTQGPAVGTETLSAVCETELPVMKDASLCAVAEKDSTEGASVILSLENTKLSGLRARKAALNHDECMKLEVDQKKQTNDLLIQEKEYSSIWHLPLSTDPAFATIKFSNGQGSNREHDTQISKKGNRRTSDGKESCQTQDTTVVRMAESVCIITEEAKMDLRPGHIISDDQPLSKCVAEMQSSGSSAVAKQHTECVTVKEIINHSPDTNKQGPAVGTQTLSAMCEIELPFMKDASLWAVVEKDSTEGTFVILSLENTKLSGLRARKAGLNHDECMKLEVDQKKQTNDLLIQEKEYSSIWHLPLSTYPAFATMKFSNGQGSNREHDTQISKKANRCTSDGKESCQTQDTSVVKMAESVCIITEEAKMDLRPGHNMSDDQPLSKWVEEMQSSGSSAVAKQHTECVTVNEIIKDSPDTNKQHIFASDETDTQGPAVGTETLSAVCETELPFTKDASLWAIVESFEAIRKMPQKPHFRPLLSHEESSREDIAIACMVDFCSAVESISRLQFDDPKEKIDDILDTLNYLESHGFSVQLLRDWIRELASIKEVGEQLQATVDVSKKEVALCFSDISELDNEIDDFRTQMKKLQDKIAKAEAIKVIKEGEIAILDCKMQDVEEIMKKTRSCYEELADAL